MQTSTSVLPFVNLMLERRTLTKTNPAVCVKQGNGQVRLATGPASEEVLPQAEAFLPVQ